MTIEALALLLAAFGLQGAEVAIVGSSGLDGPARHGLRKVTAALEARGDKVGGTAAKYAVRIGCGSGMQVRGPQSFAIRRAQYQGKRSVDVCGGGARGLMYGLLDVAERVGWAKGADPFERVREVSESPYLEERGISMYTMQRAYFESRLFAP